METSLALGMSKKSAAKAYKKLSKLSEETYLLSSTGALVNWDQETYMPRGGVEFRAKQSAYLEGKRHELATQKKIGKWIAECEDAGFAKGSEKAANVKEWRYQFDRDTKLPTSLVEEYEETRSIAHAAWIDARESDDFSKFAPHLQKVLDLKRQRAECFGYEDHVYDAFLEEYERGAKTKEIQKLFAVLEEGLIPIVQEATTQDARVPKDFLAGTFPEANQAEFNRVVAEAIGFDFESGRIDTAVHPFCTTLGPRDIRLTTRYDEDDFMGSLYGVLHEAGHGMYEQGLPGNHNGKAARPFARAVSLGIHESQSRLWENHVGRSRAFWKRWLPTAKKHFPELKGITVAKMGLAVNQAEKSFIRVEADEVTYDLHVILRFRIEQALATGDLAVKDLPDAWNQTFHDLFGQRVTNNRDGCLQDVHWSFGLMGYFPTYSLGNINAAQLFHYAMKDSTIASDLEEGEFGSLLSWLQERIHSQGTRYSPKKLIKKATGEAPNVNYLLEHLRARLYQITNIALTRVLRISLEV